MRVYLCQIREEAASGPTGIHGVVFGVDGADKIIVGNDPEFGGGNSSCAGFADDLEVA